MAEADGKKQDTRIKRFVEVSPHGSIAPLSMPEKSVKPGDKMPDGTIYVGLSPDTQQPLYTTPADAPLTYTFNEARQYAATLDAHNHKDWRVPTKGELNLLWENRDAGALKGTFNLSGSLPAGWYWSSTQDGIARAWDQRFRDGAQSWDTRFLASCLRCVR